MKYLYNVQVFCASESDENAKKNWCQSMLIGWRATYAGWIDGDRKKQEQTKGNGRRRKTGYQNCALAERQQTLTQEEEQERQELVAFQDLSASSQVKKTTKKKKGLHANWEMLSIGMGVGVGGGVGKGVGVCVCFACWKVP